MTFVKPDTPTSGRLKLLRQGKGDFTMPTETIIPLAAIVAMFFLFAGVLAWGNHQSGSLPPRK